MKRKIHLKRKFNIRTKDKVVIIVLIILLITFLLSSRFSTKSSSAVFEYAKNETTLLSTLIINDAIDEYTNEFNDIENFIIETKDKEGNIISVDFNTINVNKSLNLINERILLNLKHIEKEKLSLVSNLEYIESKGSIIYFLPIGVMSDNIFLTSLGPKIPLKMNPIGRIISNIKTEIQEYGLNNVLFKLYIEVNVTQLVLLPFISESVEVVVSIPIIIKLIEGSIPEVYGGLLTNTSSLNSLKVE